MSISQPLTIVRGKTLELPIHWETDPIVRKAIAAIDLSSGAPRITATGHGLLGGWRAYCYGIKGTRELNAEDPASLRDKDFYKVTVIDENTVEFNAINAADFTAYVSGGFLAWYSPRDLTGYAAEVVIKDKIGGTILLSSRASDTPMNLITATVDNATKTISLGISADTTADLAWKKGVWEVEMHSPTGVVTSLVAPSPVTVSDEVAT